MILSFVDDLEKIKKGLTNANQDGDWEAMLALAEVYFSGRQAGIEHAVSIVQRKAINPMPIVAEIRKPVR